MERLKKICDSTSSVFICGCNSSFFDDFINKATHSKIKINHEQYGNGMGLLEPRNHFPHGIKLYPERNFDNLAQRLYEIGASDKLFIEHLTLKNDPTINDCENYLSENIIFPGYTQTFIGSAEFVLFQALKVNGEKPIDFILPSTSIDEKNIRALIEPKLREIGINSEDILFVSKQDLKNKYQENNIKQRPKIRILSPFITKSEDYKALFSIATEGTGCSGDNSISDSFSSEALPFFQYKAGPIGRFYYQQLLETLKHEYELSYDADIKSALRKLQTYFELMTCILDDYRCPREFFSEEYKRLNVPVLFDANMWTEPDAIQNYISPGEDISTQRQYYIDTTVLDKSKSFGDWCEQLAELARNPEIIAGWSYFRQKLFEKYNVRAHFGALIRMNMLERAKEQADYDRVAFDEDEFKKMILETDQVKKCFLIKDSKLIRLIWKQFLKLLLIR